MSKEIKQHRITLLKSIHGRHSGQSEARELSFRVPMKVVDFKRFKVDGCYSACPRCATTLDREYMNFCDRCGQKLEW